MSVQKIQPNDTLETGFRAKYNETSDEIIVGYEWITPQGSQTFTTGDILQLKKYGGGFINITVSQYYVTTASLSNQLATLTGIPYKGDWLGAEYPSSVTVSYNGTLWRSTAATSSGDEPGVSNKWVNILAPSLYEWNADYVYAKDNTVRYTISGVNYQFYSLIDDNGSEPALISTDWAVLGAPAATPYTPPTPIENYVPAGTSLTDNLYRQIAYDPALYTVKPRIEVCLSSDGNPPYIEESFIKRVYYDTYVRVFLPNDGNGVTLDGYQITVTR